ncbi:hypothetical protein FDT66_12235 [Polaribacter aestuariivivens]|uniref:O-antigen ligase family protein n=1 Tax=Polaribacter aestuariivivens TaxID=2304626 RepID=A0A5S3N6R6_9FLAO|nr:hypothetical protein [Polaribacter aestuariivivens]TMM29149.1 hypothetical protein FDT66_12235 [Polaribacter aestuariivivens]
MSYRNKNTSFKNKTYRLYSGLLIIGSFVFILGLLNNYTDSKYFGRLVFDLFAFSLILSGITFVNVSRKLWVKFLNTYFFWTILFILIGIPSLDFNYFLTASSRNSMLIEMAENSTYKINYVAQMTTLALVPLILIISIQFGKKKHVVLTVAMLFLYLFNGFYYAKKNVLFELIFLVIVLIFFYLKGKARFRLLISLFISVFVFMYIFSESIFVNRFENRIDTAVSTERNDRLVEADTFFASYELHDYVLGRGFGGFVENTVGGSVLHIGLINFIFKFGFLCMVVLFLFITKKIIDSFFKRKMLTNKFEIIMSMFFLVYMVSSPMWSWYTNMLYFPFMVFGSYIITAKNSNLC